jgi:hypothetical protein
MNEITLTTDSYPGSERARYFPRLCCPAGETVARTNVSRPGEEKTYEQKMRELKGEGNSGFYAVSIEKPDRMK